MSFDRSRMTEYLIYLLSPAFFIGKSYKVVAGLVVLFFLIDLFKNKRFDIFKDTIFLVLTAWCSYLALSSCWAIQPVDALMGASELFVWCLLYLAIRTTLVSQEKIEFFIKLQVGMVLFVFVNSIMQVISGFNMFGVPLCVDRATDLIDQRWTTGHILPIWIGLFGAILALPIKDKKFYLSVAIALIALLITIPLTGTRGPIIIMAIFLPLIAWMSPFRKQAFAMLGLILVVIATIVATSATLQERFTTLAHPFENQKHYRIPIWLTAFEEFKDNPIGGVGFHNFRFNELKYYQESFDSYEINPKTGAIINHPHSPWADILSEQGIIGLSFALTLLFLIARNSYSMGPVVIIGSMGVWYTFSVLNSSFVLSSDKWSFFMILTISFFSIVMNYHKISNTNKETEAR